MTGPEDRRPDTVARAARLFSTPLEVGLRSVFLLGALTPARCDVQRLVILDYLLVHSGDVDGGPPSLHPATPHRAGELLVKRDLLRDGLMVFVARELVAMHLDADGVRFAATDLTAQFLAYFDVPYASRIRDAAAWVAAHFGPMDDEQLERYVAARLDRWGGEFSAESLVREVTV